jgi:hypothetical protein
LYIPILEQFLNKNTPIVVNLKKDKEESLEFGGSFGGFWGKREVGENFSLVLSFRKD